jgi:hypothetical protein
MRHLAVSLCPLLALAVPAIAAPAPEESWGKPGVSLEQYRRDALDCGKQGYYLDIANSEDAKEFVRASRKLDSLPMGTMAPSTTGAGSTGPASTDSAQTAAEFAGIQQHIIDGVRPDARFKNIKQMQLAAIGQCLVQRGYAKFRLTDDQRHQLRRLKFGSDQRRAYLYNLASNPAVLQSQAVAAKP